MMERNPHDQRRADPDAAPQPDTADDAAPEQTGAGTVNGASPAPEQQVAEMKDKFLRALAEAENMRRRAERERDEAGKFAVANFARDVVGVADNLRRTLESAKSPAESDSAKLKALVEGVELTERSLLGMLERFNVKVVEPLGQKFDPNLHQAMFEVPDTGKEPGTVVQVIQPGFTIAGRLLRPAMVGVAKASAARTDTQTN
jgi:molecular chaperone GrpE